MFILQAKNKTKPLVITFFVIAFVVIPFLIFWLMFGEFNLNDHYWLVIKNKVYWSGKVTDENINLLVSQFARFGITYEELQRYLNKTVNLIANETHLENKFVYILLGIYFWTFIFPLMIKFARVANFDLWPIVFGSGNFMFIMIITSLIPGFGSNYESLHWMLRIFIALGWSLFIFVLFNKIVNKVFSKSLDDLSKEVYEQNIIKQNKSKIDIFNKPKKDKEEYIEI